MMGGNAVLLASQKLRNVLSKKLDNLDCKPEEVKFSNDTVYCENRSRVSNSKSLRPFLTRKGSASLIQACMKLRRVYGMKRLV